MCCVGAYSVAGPVAKDVQDALKDVSSVPESLREGLAGVIQAGVMLQERQYVNSFHVVGLC